MYQNTNEGSEEGGDIAGRSAPVDASLIATTEFWHAADGMFNRAFMGTLTADNAVGQFARDALNDGWFNPTDIHNISLGKQLSPDEANQQYGTNGLKFDQPIYEARARYLRMLHDDDARYQAIMAARAPTWTSWAASQAGSFVGGFFDPAQAALMLIPPMRIAGVAARLGLSAGEKIIFPTAAQFIEKSLLERATMRATQGATTGVVQGTISGGMDWALSSQEQRDYKMSNLLQSMLYGGVSNALLSPVIGAAGDAVKKILKPQSPNLPGGNVDKGNLPVEVLQPHDIAEIHANGGNVSRAISLNDQVVAAEMKAGRPLSEAEKIQVMSEKNGARLPDEMQQPVAEEKSKRVDSFRAEDETRSAQRAADSNRNFENVGNEDKAIAEAATPEEKLAAVESSANAREAEAKAWESNKMERATEQGKALTAHWNQVPVTLHGTEASLREAVPSTAGNSKVIKGLYDPATGSVHIALDNIRTPADLAEALRHEGVHAGFSRLLPEKYAALWEKMSSDIEKSLRVAGKGSELDQIQSTYEFPGKAGLIEEYMARQVNAGKDMGLFSGMLTKLKLFLAKVIPSAVKWSEKDIQNLVGLAEQKLAQGGERAGTSSSGLRFNQENALSQDEFYSNVGKQWMAVASNPKSSIFQDSLKEAGHSIKDHIEALDPELAGHFQIEPRGPDAEGNRFVKLFDMDVPNRELEVQIDKNGELRMNSIAMRDSRKGAAFYQGTYDWAKANGLVRMEDRFTTPDGNRASLKHVADSMMRHGSDKHVTFNKAHGVEQKPGQTERNLGEAMMKFAELTHEQTGGIFRDWKYDLGTDTYRNAEGAVIQPADVTRAIADHRAANRGNVAPRVGAGRGETPPRVGPTSIRKALVSAALGERAQAGRVGAGPLVVPDAAARLKGIEKIRYSLSVDETPRPSLEEQLAPLNAAVEQAKSPAEKLAALQAKRAALIDYQVKDQLDSHLARSQDPGEGMASYLGGAPDSVDARVESLKGEYNGVLFNRLTQSNLLREFKSAACQSDIARELWKLGMPEDVRSSMPGGSDPRFEKIAKLISDVRKTAVARENRAGSFAGDSPDSLFRQSHDMGTIRAAGFEPWRDFISSKLDWDQIERQHAAQGDGFDREKFLRGAYDGIMAGVPWQEAGTLRPGGEPMPANEAQRLGASRELRFSSADSFLDYNTHFGTRNLGDAVVSGLESLAHSTALKEKLGTTPGTMFENTLSELPDNGREQALRNQFGAVSGLDRIPGNVSQARIDSGVRAWSDKVRMGQALLDSLPNMTLGQRALERQGLPVLHAMDNALLRGVDHMAGQDGQRLAVALGAGAQQFMEDLLKRADTSYPLTGREYWDSLHKRSVARAMSSWLGENADQDFEHLDPSTQDALTRSSLGEKQWDAIRESAGTSADGNRYVLPEQVQSIPNDVLKALKADEGFTGSLARFRDDLQTRWTNYFADSSRDATARPGTPLGEMIRFAEPFKKWGMTYLTRPAGRELYGRTATMERFAGMTTRQALSTALGYASVQLRQLASGEAPLPATMQTFEKSLVQGGGLGIAADYLSGQSDPKSLTGLKLGLDYGVMYRLQDWLNPGYLERTAQNLKNNPEPEYSLSTLEAAR